jgi:hypothetical protein
MNRDIYEAITARFIEQLKRGTVPWQKPWFAVQNIVSRKPHRGINALSTRRSRLDLENLDETSRRKIASRETLNTKSESDAISDNLATMRRRKHWAKFTQADFCTT